MFCMERGATGVETLSESETEVSLRIYFDDLPANAVENWPGEFQQVYPGLAPPTQISAGHQAGQDWHKAWRVFFRPTPAGQGLMVCPPWEVPPPESLDGRTPLVIDPGQGFGTGGHASTMLALGLLEAAMGRMEANLSVADVGTGSGILALAAMHMGVKSPVCVDIDPQALPEVRRNARLNGFLEPVLVVCGTAACLHSRFDLVLANLTAPILLSESDAIADLTSRGGRLILSGMLVREREEVLNTFASLGLVTEATAEQEEWGAACLVNNQSTAGEN